MRLSALTKSEQAFILTFTEISVTILQILANPSSMRRISSAESISGTRLVDKVKQICLSQMLIQSIPNHQFNIIASAKYGN